MSNGDDAGVRGGTASGTMLNRKKSNQSYDPEGDSGGPKQDYTMGGIFQDPLENNSPLNDQDLQESMSQPSGEGGSHPVEGPPPDLSGGGFYGNLDPLINWGEGGKDDDGEEFIGTGQSDLANDLGDPPKPESGGDGLEESPDDLDP